MTDSADDENSKRCHIAVSYYADIKINHCRTKKERFCCGYLIGNECEDNVFVHDLVELDHTLFGNTDQTEPQSDAIQAEFACIRASFPVGLDFVGVFITQPEQENIEVAEHLLKLLKQLQDIDFAEDFIMCLIKPSICIWSLVYPNAKSTNVEQVSSGVKNMPSQPMFRVRKQILLSWLVESEMEGIPCALDKIDYELYAYKPAFLIRDTDTVIYDLDDGRHIPDRTTKELVNELREALDVKTCSFTGDRVIEVESLVKITSDVASSDEHQQCSVPVLNSHDVSGMSWRFSGTLDVLVSAALDTSTSKLLHMFRDALLRQITALRLLTKVDRVKYLYRPTHFQPSQSCFPITVFLPSCDLKGVEVLEEARENYKRKLHERFLLPCDRPVFRNVLACFHGRSTKCTQLVNPHVGLRTPEGGKVALVDGKYAYHHYMQDNFNDCVWGCAYRSLQTLASWFWLQGYTGKQYPSHREIQEALVAMGDKERNFIDSTEWIGSMEVSYCLDHLYGITCKTLHVSTGAEMTYKGRDLYNHFVDEGTPVMIGGGVLAHTIVGVMFNEQTGDVKFLIVDPHFTGADNLKTVQSKGWVGWKGADSWNQTAHYNMCMPQRPKVI